jgi:DNA-binding transcriptional ArsR family regulator
MLTEKQIAKIRKGLNGNAQRVAFKILADSNRYRISQILNEHLQLSVSDISKILKISIPLASQHLKVLEQGNILQKEKRGQNVYFKLRTDNRIAQIIIQEIMLLGL